MNTPPLLLITCIDAPESTVNYLSSWLTPVREMAPVTIFVFKNVSWFSWKRPADFQKFVVQFPDCAPVLHIVESTVDANPHKQGRSDCDKFRVLAG